MSEKSKVWNPWMEGIKIGNWFSGICLKNGRKGERNWGGFSGLFEGRGEKRRE